jgi:DNA polymerase
MRTIRELGTEYQDIVLDLEDLFTRGGFRRGGKPGAPRLIVQSSPAPRGKEPSGADASRAASDLQELAAQVRLCALCPLCEKRRQAVPGAGVLDPLVMVIGEAPGEEEDLRGEPFVGPAGVYLDKWLSAVGLSRLANAFIANIVKCRPPANRDPLPEEAAACMPYLLRQIKIIRPRAVLALGRVAAQNLLGTSEGIGRLRGIPGTWQGLPFLATYHPSAVLRDHELRRPVWEDMKKLKELLDGT